MNSAIYKVIPFAVLSFAFILADSCSNSDDVLRTRDDEVIQFGKMIGEIRKANIVFVGESHGSERDHEIQLDVIKALHKAGAQLAIGTEMFRADSQKQLDEWTKGTFGLNDFLKVYYNNWNMPWPLYEDIFIYARDNKIPIIGLNVPEEITQKVSREGFSSLTDAEMKQLPPGISCNVDPTYMDFIRRAYSVHDKDEKSFVSFCEAQMIWDKSMAWHLTEFLKKNPDKTVVVLAGIGHSWKRGIPEQVKQLSRLSCMVVLPEVPEHASGASELAQDADYIMTE